MAIQLVLDSLVDGGLERKQDLTGAAFSLSFEGDNDTKIISGSYGNYAVALNQMTKTATIELSVTANSVYDKYLKSITNQALAYQSRTARRIVIASNGTFWTLDAVNTKPATTEHGNNPGENSYARVYNFNCTVVGAEGSI